MSALLRRSEQEANAKPYDSRAQSEYLGLLNEAGFHEEVLRRGASGKFAAGGKVYQEVQRARDAVGGGLGSMGYHHQSGGPMPGGAPPAPVVSMKGSSPRNPLHVVVSGRSSPFTVFGRVLSVGFTIFLCVILFQSMKGGTGGGIRGPLENLSGGFTEDTKEIPDTTFADVKGVDEAKEELEHIVDYLKHPEKYTQLGGKIPRGVLLTGPPGTGKTLLARAIAGEAEVPFYSRSASEFEEMLVGLGASRVRKLFAAARENAPCIIFIDEIDAIGGKRMKLSTVGHDRQTLNQLLASMDGFVKSEGVIVLAATNFPESLDSALTRPGRFDVSVTVPLPDVKGREQILELYLSKVSVDDTVHAETLARATPGMSGADLETLINTAALRAAKRDAKFISIEDVDEAKDKLMLGPARRNKVVRPETLRKTAFHEAGHTLVALLTKGAMPIYKTTILPRGQTAGVTYFLPEYKDEGNMTRGQIMAQLDVAMGGRVAEELIFGAEEVTTGAGSDMQSASSLARQFVMQFSMSQLGLSTYDRNSPPSPETQATIDREVKRILDESYERAMTLLKTHRTELDRLAAALVKHETLTLEEMKQAIKGKKLPTEEQKKEERAAAHKKKLNKEPEGAPKKAGGWFGWGSSSGSGNGSGGPTPKAVATPTPKPEVKPLGPAAKPDSDKGNGGGGRQWV